MIFQTVRWFPFSDAHYSRMSQYGHHHSHYQSPVGSDKPWDLVAAAAAAAAANVNNSIKSPVSGAFSFPNGFQTVNGGGNNGSNGNGGVYLNNGSLSASSSSSHQNLHITQSPPTWQQQETSRLYGINQQNSAWVDHQQRQTQQQAHHQAQILSGSASSYFASHHLTSPTSPLSSRATAGWSKLPQALISAVADDSSSKYETHSQQSPTYLSSRYGINSSSSTAISSGASDSNASFNGLLSASGSAAAAAAVVLSKLPQYQSAELAYQQKVNDLGSQSGSLYHSSLELEMLRTLANSAAKNTGSDVFSSKMSSFSPPMSNYNSSALNDVGMRGINSVTFSAYFASNANLAGVKREPSVSPQLDSTDLEAAKTMLSIQTNVAKENSSSLNCEYQQISPAVSDTSTKDHSSLDGTNQNDASFINKGYNSNSHLSKTDTTLVSNRNLQISRDEMRAQKNIDVPTVNNIERSSIPTSAKNAQENSEKRSIINTGYSKDHIKYSDNASTMQNRLNEDNLSEHSSQGGNISSGVSVVSRQSSAQGTSPATMAPCKASASPKDKTISENVLNGSSAVSNRVAHPTATLSSPSSNPPPPNRSGSISSTAPISGYGIQSRPATNQGTIYNCHICKFSSTSKFHFNSHMNTHADHKCTFCDYTSRTEGRLKRHMKDFHTHPNTEDILMESEDFDGRCSPPSPDENSALIEQELLAVVSSVAHQPSEYGSSNSSTKDKPATSGKPKTYRCKQCTFLATSKTEFWLHQKSAHIKGDRVLSCPKCLFVTEYKHHLEYHLRNHFGSKPFKCNKCNYSCVNKSMLNSHMKSHSNFYQYRCDDCTYATKYCHSLKMHLRKYGHRPASVINMDGSSTEPTVIDVYGNRRGPRSKKNNAVNSSTTNSVQSMNALLPPIPVSSGLNGNNISSNTTSLAPLMEALQNSYLKQQQDIATAMVTSIATLGAQLPTVPSSFGQRSDSTLLEEDLPSHSSSSQQQQQFLKCSLCDFETEDGKEVLTVHVMTHIMKNKDLCNLYGLGETATSSTNSSSSTPNENFNGSSHHFDVSGRLSSTPKDDQRSRSSSFVTRFADTISPVRASPMQELSQDSNSPASASCDKNSGDESVGGGVVEVTQRKSRRRKGKAYKLDKIALRLQGRTSPALSSSKDEEPEIMDDSTEIVNALSATTSALYPNLCANPINEAAEEESPNTPVSKR